MSLRVRHNRVSSGTSNPSVEVDLAAWNEDHPISGTADATQLNASVVQAVVSDTNVTGAIATQTLTLGWTGTLAGARGGFGADVSASSGVPLFATGVATFTGTSGTGNFVRVTSPTLVTPALGAATATSVAIGGATIGANALAVTGSSALGALTVTSNTSTSFAVGPNGGTNPAFDVDSSAASQACGLKVAGAATGGTVSLAVIDSGSNANISIDGKGTGTITLGGTSTGAITLSRATTLSAALTYGGVTLSNAVTGTGNMVLSAGPTLTGTLTASVGNFSSTLSSAALTVTSASASSLTVGLNGATNPSLQVDSSVGSQVAGLKVSGAVTGGTVALAAIDSGSTTNISVNAKGTGVVFLSNVSSGGTQAFGSFMPQALLDISRASAGQIKFPSSQNASANANTLDDYAEGTFTPTVTFGGGSTGITYSTQLGKYTKIGNVVHYAIHIILTSKGSSTGTAVINALPFTASANDAAANAQMNSMAASATTATQAYVSASTTTILLFRFTAGIGNQLADTDFTNASIIRISGLYFV